MARRGGNRNNAHQETFGSEADYWIRTIQEIFPDPGWTSNELLTNDDGSPATKNLLEAFAGKRWQELSSELLQTTWTEPRRFTRGALAYFMPAYLVWQLEKKGNLQFTSEDLDFRLTQLLPAREIGFTYVQVRWLHAFWSWATRDWTLAEDIEEAKLSLDLLAIELTEFESEGWSNVCPFFSTEAPAIICKIKEAFRGVSREGAMSWSRSQIADNYGSVEGLYLFNDKDECWEDLVDDSDWRPEDFGGGFPYLDPIGARYYLPAALLKSIKQGQDAGIQFWLEHDPKETYHYVRVRWSLLDQQQIMTVIDFTIFMAHSTKALGHEDEGTAWLKTGQRFSEAMGIHPE